MLCNEKKDTTTSREEYYPVTVSKKEGGLG